jgi:1,4-alpha-glucan branching enzyme
MWDVIYPLEDKFLRVLKKLKGGDSLAENDLLRTIMEQAARELLLLEASDWEFVISTQGAIEYSKERFGRHAELLTQLLEMAEDYDAGVGINEDEAETLQEALIVDRPFTEVDLGWWDSPQ